MPLSLRVMGSLRPRGLTKRSIPGTTRGIGLLPISPSFSLYILEKKVSRVLYNERNTKSLESCFTPGIVCPREKCDSPPHAPDTIDVLFRLRSPNLFEELFNSRFAALFSRGFNHKFM